MTLPRRHLLTLIAASLAVGCAHAEAVTGSGRLQTEPRNLAGFEAVALEASFRLVVRQAAAEAVQVRADDNLLPLIETLVEQRSGRPTLVVRWKRNTSIRHHSDIQVSVDAVRLRALAAEGSGSIVSDTIKSDRFSMTVAGSGDITVGTLGADEVDASIAGSGDVKAGGKAARVKVSIAGSGDASVTANQALAVTIAGSGDVRYGGAVTGVKTTVLGSGDVRRR